MATIIEKDLVVGHAYVVFAFWVIAWLVAIAVLVLISLISKDKGVISSLLVITILSMPMFIFCYNKYTHYQVERHHKEQKNSEEHAFKKYAEICSRPQQMEIYEKVISASPVDIIIRNEDKFFRRLNIHNSYLSLDIMEDYSRLTEPDYSKFQSTSKGLCWLEASSAECKIPPISNVQWEAKVYNGVRFGGSRKDIFRHIMWSYDPSAKQRTEISSLSASYIVNIEGVSENGYGSIKYKISVTDVSLSKVFSETILYRQLGTHQLPKSCPDRDKAIGNLLSETFILKK